MFPSPEVLRSQLKPTLEETFFTNTHY